MITLELEQFADYLAPRPRAADKSYFGHVLVVGGDFGFSGAVHLAGEAALRVGAGLVSIATRPEHALVMNVTSPELMCHGIVTPTDLEPLMERATVIVVGPGLGRSPWSETLLQSIFQTDKNMVVDADGLNLLAHHPRKNANWILTPHLREAARLLNTPFETVKSEKVDAAKKIQNQFGGVCVLKSAETLVCDTKGMLSICEYGNPGMATGGTGDVLSGVLGGLLAQGVPLADAAKLGVTVHATAGDLAAADGGERGMIASDLMMYLRHVVNLGSSQL